MIFRLCLLLIILILCLYLVILRMRIYRVSFLFVCFISFSNPLYCRRNFLYLKLNWKHLICQFLFRSWLFCKSLLLYFNGRSVFFYLQNHIFLSLIKIIAFIQFFVVEKLRYYFIYWWFNWKLVIHIKCQSLKCQFLLNNLCICRLFLSFFHV